MKGCAGIILHSYGMLHPLFHKNQPGFQKSAIVNHLFQNRFSWFSLNFYPWKNIYILSINFDMRSQVYYVDIKCAQYMLALTNRPGCIRGFDNLVHALIKI